MRSMLFVRLVVVCYLPGLQNAPFYLTMTEKIIAITRSTYDLLKTIEFIKKWFRKRDEIKQKGIYIINVDVFKHPNEIMQFITDLKCEESNSICKYSGIRVRVFNWNIKLVMTVRTIRRADKVEGQNENEMLEEVDDDIRPRQKSTRKRTTAKLYILIQK